MQLLRVDDKRRQGHWVVTVNFDLIDDANAVLTQMQEWCLNNKCGRRTSYDQFWFRNKKELNWFLLRYS